MHILNKKAFKYKKCFKKMEIEHSSPMKKHQLVKSMMNPNLTNDGLLDRQYVHQDR